MMGLFVSLFNDEVSEYTWNYTRTNLNLTIQENSNGFKVNYN